MRFEEQVAKMAVEQAMRELRVRMDYERRFGFVKFMRSSGCRAHRKWKHARASGLKK